MRGKSVFFPFCFTGMLVVSPVEVHCFSSISSFGVLERFRAACPADENSVRQFDASLVGEESNDQTGSIWVAVYRTNHNKPSVFVRDEFFHAMNEATTTTTTTETKSSPVEVSPLDTTSKLETPMALEKPVAVAQLHPSPDYDKKWVLANLRCALKKEDLDESCDGGSEFSEALAVCVDSLLLQYLKEQTSEETMTTKASFENAIRTKTTLFSNKLVEERGFEPVEELSKDMATHVSRYQACLESYAERSSATKINPGARDRALQIVALLGQLIEGDEDVGDSTASDEDTNDDYDPWANAASMLR